LFRDRSVVARTSLAEALILAFLMLAVATSLSQGRWVMAAVVALGLARHLQLFATRMHRDVPRR
jgi:hypothetical protein